MTNEPTYPSPQQALDIIAQQREKALLGDECKLGVQSELLSARGKMCGGDGYDRMGERKNWHPVPSWGRDGWDLGDWPYVVISHTRTSLGWGLLYDVEGDATIYTYPVRELRDAATDILAFFHWRSNSEPWVEGIEHAWQAPAHLRGPYSHKRSEQEDSQ